MFVERFKMIVILLDLILQ